MDSAQTLEIAGGVAADNYADSMYPNSAYGNRPILYVGNSYDRAQNLSGPARIYIQFDLSAIPGHALVTSAEMILYQMYAPLASQTYEVHVVESPWEEYAMNWTTQPASGSAVISTALVPAQKDILVSWNVTSGVQRWVNGEVPNYGFMIGIQNERTGVANEASGFYSREYPKEEFKPKLRVFCRNNAPFTYLFTIHLSGLPDNLLSTVTVDDAVRMKAKGGGTVFFLFASGTRHVIAADEYVNAGKSVRYHAKSHSIVVNADSEFTVAYEPQFLITIRSEPPGLVGREESAWYELGTRIETPIAPGIATDEPDMRIVFGGWYANDTSQPGNPISYSVEGPLNVTARYVTLYKVSVNSSLGNVSGSGWHARGSRIEISVTPTYVPTEGILGYLGMGMTFDHWSGSFDSTSPRTTLTVNGPSQATAVWRDDRSRFVLGVAIGAGLALVAATLRTRAKRRRPEDRLRNAETRSSSQSNLGYDIGQTAG